MKRKGDEMFNGDNAVKRNSGVGGPSGQRYSTFQPAPVVQAQPIAQPQASLVGGQPLTTTDALSYLREVKDHFKTNKAVYDVFLDIMKEFKARRIDTADVIRRVKELFKGHDNLILGFNTFVPKGYEIKLEDVRAEAAAAKAEAEAAAAAKAERERERDSTQPSTGGADSSASRGGAAGPGGTGQAAGDGKGKRPVEYDQAFNYVNKIRTRFRYDERVYNAFLEILNMYRKGQKTITNVYQEVASLFKDHADLLEEFEYFLPDNTTPGAGGGMTMQQAQANLAKGKLASRGPVKPMDLQPGLHEMRRNINKRKSARRAEETIRRQGDSDPEGEERKAEDRKLGKSANLGKELQFFDKVKARLRNREAYQDLLKCLNIYNQEVITKHELQTLVHDILGRNQDLMGGFNEFLARCETMDIDLTDVTRSKDGKLSLKDMQRVKQQVLGNREKFQTRPVSELDLSDCERCGPSYRLLPKSFPKPMCSNRTELCMQVLNDAWVNVTSGSEDYSFKQMRKNQYEESLFRCEDDRFELDMVIETNESTCKVLQPLADQLAEMAPEAKAAFRLGEGSLSAVHLRCVERIYGEHGADMRELMLKNPAVAVPVVLKRLRQKDEEWRKTREEMNKVWAEVYLKNYHKSLDHRSFYFKQMDKKSTGSKGMLAEIKEVSEKRKREEEGIVVAAAANRRPLCPDLRFPCNKQEVHDDVFKVLKFSLSEWSIISAESGNKYLNLYRNFLEPFLRLPPREDEGIKEKESDEESDDKEDETDLKAVEPDPEVETKPETVRAESEPATEARATADVDVKPSLRAPGPEEEEEEKESCAAVTYATEDVAAASGSSEGDTVKLEVEEAEEAEELDDGELAIDDAPMDQEEDEEEEQEAAEEEEKSESEAVKLEQSFRGCKPLASAAESEPGEAAPPGPVTPVPKPPHGPQVFYAHEGLYMFFRLHQHLYERIAVAHKEAAAVQAKKTAEAAAAGLPPPAEPVISSFFTILFKLLEGTGDPSKYEDECRALLGNNAYMLFTLDKLLLKLMKQIQALHCDDLSIKLLRLYEYEKSRGVAFRDDVYHANACVLLNEETCYRIEYAADDHLTLQLMEGGQDKSELTVGAMDTTFAEYLHVFLQSSPSQSERSGVFLARNLQNEGGEEKALVDVRIQNGLECKISCNTSKVSYVLDTEDLFHRRRRGAKAKVQRTLASAPTKKEQLAIERFHSWLEKHAADNPVES